MSGASSARRLVPKAHLALATLVLVGVLLVLWAGPADAATTFTVNSAGDAGDRKINGVCDVSRNRGKQCTLRAAIEEANATSGADKISFNIGGTAAVKTISPAAPLPVITDTVAINGYSQAGASENTRAMGNNAVLKIQLNGTNAGTKEQGLRIRAADSVIKGLVINRFELGGVEISGTGVTARVEGNFIGTNANGSGALGNGGAGVRIGSANNTIGGTEPGARNVISGNAEVGVLIRGAAATGNRVEGNFIGTNASGTADLENTIDGVQIDNAPNTTIGGTEPGARNVISGGGFGSGVRIVDTGATGNRVEGNFIGTKANGNEALGNNSDGVFIGSAPNNTIGGTDADDGTVDEVVKARNVISGNKFDGVLISGTGATGNKVLGNLIGTNADGDGALGNGFGGVNVGNSASNNTIGGTASGEGNRIAHNGQDGVSISSGVGNSVLGNSIFSNTGLGIDLGGEGVTNNDTGDTDTGAANNLQNFPTITSITQSSSFLNPTMISGTLNSKPSQNFTVQCFLAEDSADTSGHGEGKVFMAEDTDVRTNASGDASFECNFLFPVSLEGKRWSATATNEATGDTSEFSANFPV